MTTSCGRVLDAISAILDVCQERTYEGEPAMKLESVAFGGEDVLGLEPMLNGEAIETTSMIRTIFANLGRFSVRDLAYSAQSYVARSLGNSATIVADELGLETIGFTGGVASNEAITRILRATVESEGLHFLVHESVPPGDGGLSFGQAVVASQST
jgi:hydrogenase maturation protein HypF